MKWTMWYGGLLANGLIYTYEVNAMGYLHVEEKRIAPEYPGAPILKKTWQSTSSGAHRTCLSVDYAERMEARVLRESRRQFGYYNVADPKVAAIVEAACAMFDSPKAGIGQLKAAVRAYEEK